MARVSVAASGERLEDAAAIEAFLARHGIWYRRFAGDPLPPDAGDDDVLAAHADAIEELRREGGYVTADVISVHPDTPGLDEMMQKFATEHTHTEDEVRLIVSGNGLFHVHPVGSPVFGIEVTAGDMINVPAGTRHWFHLCQDRAIRAIRLFQDTAGWVPRYTGSGVDARHRPLCFGVPG